MAAVADSECNTVTLAKDGLINLERPFPLSRSTSQTSRAYGPPLILTFRSVCIPIGLAYASTLAENQARGAMIENTSALFSQIKTGTLLSRMAG